MTVAREHLRAKLERANKRVEQLQAQQALMDMRRQTKEQARLQYEQRRRRFEHGEAVEEAGFASWSKAELSGLLLRAREHFGASDSTRRMLAQHADHDTHRSPPTVH